MGNFKSLWIFGLSKDKITRLENSSEGEIKQLDSFESGDLIQVEIKLDSTLPKVAMVILMPRP